MDVTKKRMKSITKIVMDQFHDETVEDINGGDCYWWAWYFYKKYGCELFTVKSLGAHAFIRIGNMFYDAETLNGVKDWRNLKSWWDSQKVHNCSYGKAILMEENEFRKYWNIRSNAKIPKIKE